jgi:hypothetical protein
MVDITITLSAELPFWIPIKSGTYNLRNGRELRLRNDFWIVSVTNFIDGPANQPFEYIVNEHQVFDHNYLKFISQGKARYFHKEKMKTTFTRAFSVVPKPGIITAQIKSEEWWQQIFEVVFRLVGWDAYNEFLSDINSFIELFSTIIGVSNPSTELRRISFFDTMLRVMIIAIEGEDKLIHLTRVVPDIERLNQPFPFYRVRKLEDLKRFKETLQIAEPPVFHQIQWAKALNYLREQRHQEALLSADLVLDALVYRYHTAIGLSKKQMKRLRRDGLSNVVRALDFPELVRECRDVADMRDLRNEVVHEEKVLMEEDRASIRAGIEGLKLLRSRLLQESGSGLIELEQSFHLFLERIPIGRSTSDPIDKMVEMRIELRREHDCYRTALRRK